MTRQPVTQPALQQGTMRLDMVRLEAEMLRGEVCAELFGAIARQISKLAQRLGHRAGPAGGIRSA